MNISITKITQFSGHKEPVYALVYNKLNKKVLSAGSDGYIVEWDIYGNGDGIALADLKTTIYSMCLSQDSRTLFAVTRSGVLHCIDIEKKTIEKRLILSSNPLFSICLKGKYLFIGDEKGKLFKLDSEQNLLATEQYGEKSIRQIIANNESLFLATSSHNIYKINNSLELQNRILGAHENSVFTLVHTETQLWSGGRDAVLKIWEDMKLNEEINAHNLHINSLDYNRENKLVLSGSMDKNVKIWDTHTPKLVKVLNKEKCDFHISSVNKVLWIGPNEFISCGDDRKVIYTEIDIK